jgi:hypothetical protein
MAPDAGACRWCKEFLKIGGRRPMARCRCCFLDERHVVVSIEELESFDDPDARRDVMALLARTGRFFGYELSRNGRKVDERTSVKRDA